MIDIEDLCKCGHHVLLHDKMYRLHDPICKDKICEALWNKTYNIGCTECECKQFHSKTQR